MMSILIMGGKQFALVTRSLTTDKQGVFTVLLNQSVCRPSACFCDGQQLPQNTTGGTPYHTKKEVVMSESDEESSGGSDWPVTTEWLHVILDSYHRRQDRRDDMVVTIEDFTVKPGCEAGECVLSDIIAVQVQYTVNHGGNPENRILDLIVKLLPHDPFSRYFVTEAQFDLREIKFYTQVVPELEEFQSRHLKSGVSPIALPIPKCYHATYTAGHDSPDSSPVPPDSVLVLENLKLRGFTSADFSRGLTMRQAEAAVDAIARLHGLSLALKVKEDSPLTERYPFLFQTARATDSYQQLVERGLPQLASFLERRPEMEEILHELQALRPNTKELIAGMLAPQEPIALITHTDFWCNNLLFREDTDGAVSCAVLDWQMVTYSRPTNDVALLIVSSLPTELRRRHTSTLLDRYWMTLTNTTGILGVNVETQLGYDRKTLDQNYRTSQLLALLLCIGSVDVALGDVLTEQRLLDVLHDLHEDGVLAYTS